MTRVTLLALCAFCLTVSASAQSRETVRVVAESAQIRLRPDPNSAVLSSPQAGTLLDVMKREGAWLVVTIPSNSGSEPSRVGFVSMTEVEPFGGTAAAAAPAVAAPSMAATPSARNSNQPDDYQLRIDQARARRDSGKKKFWIGTAAAAGGMVLAMAAVGSCDIYSCSGNDAVAAIGGWSIVGGGVLQLWGIVQWIGGSGDMSDAIAARPSGSRSMSAMPKPQLTYSLRW